MSDASGSIEGMTPADLLAFEARNPSWRGNKETRIREQLKLTPARYVTLLLRAAESVEGMAADPITARRVRTPGRRERAHVLPTGCNCSGGVGCRCGYPGVAVEQVAEDGHGVVALFAGGG